MKDRSWHEHENVGACNFDHPDAIDTKYLVQVLQKLMLRQSVEVRLCT